MRYETYTKYKLKDGKLYIRVRRQGPPVLIDDVVDGYLKYEAIREKNGKAGKKSMMSMSKEERSERAKKAVQARWNKNQ